MNKSLRNLSICLMIALIAGAAGCSRSQTGDKTSDNALKAFQKILKKYPKQIGFHNVLSHWGFKLPGGDKFEWTKNTSANKIDYAMIIGADAFLSKGFEPQKLDSKKWIYKKAEVESGTKLPNRIIRPLNISDKNQTSNGASDAMRRVIKQNHKLIVYDKDKHYYKLSLGNGNQIWWTDKLNRNKGDIVFVIEAKPFIDAGVNAAKLKKSGWELIKLSGDNAQKGQDYLMKEYNLR